LAVRGQNEESTRLDDAARVAAVQLATDLNGAVQMQDDQVVLNPPKTRLVGAFALRGGVQRGPSQRVAGSLNLMLRAPEDPVSLIHREWPGRALGLWIEHGAIMNRPG